MNEPVLTKHDHPSIAATSTAPDQPLRLLLVEDQEDDAALLLMELQRAGWQVNHTRVDNASAMRAAIAAGGWDIIISDYSMPGFSGIAALDIARATDRQTPFLLISGTVGEEVAVQAMKAGANDYMFKGNLKRLAPTIERELREASRRREANRLSHELDLRNAQLAEAYKLAHLGTWLIQFANETIVLSDESSAILGHPAGAVPRPLALLLDSLHADDRAALTGFFNAIDRSHYSADARIPLPDNTTRDVQIRCDIVRDAAGKAIEATGTIQDITERKQAERQLQQAHDDLETAKNVAESANRAKDQFLAVLSHELRTPLTPVLLTVSLLEHREQLADDVRDDLQTIRRHVELEARLIDDLLDITRITRGKLQLKQTHCNAHQLLWGAIDISGQDRMNDITVELSAERYHVTGDPARLQQIFWNLLGNAVKFTPYGRSILVRTENTATGRLRVTVRDAGVGIDPGVLPTIFNAFQQGESSLTRNFGGLGLGLAITRTLVEAHGGTIVADSAGKDSGAAFTVELPVIDPPASAPAIKRTLTFAAPPSLRLLVVDDHAATLKQLHKLLTSLGHEVSTAATVGDARTLAERTTFDLVISDLGLPDGHGHELMEELHRRFHLRGIAVSGFGMSADTERSSEVGFVSHLVKPVDLQRLKLAIDTACSH